MKDTATTPTFNYFHRSISISFTKYTLLTTCHILSPGPTVVPSHFPSSKASRKPPVWPVIPMEPSQPSRSHTPKTLELDTQSYAEYPRPIAPPNTPSSPLDKDQTPVRGHPEPFSSLVAYGRA